MITCPINSITVQKQEGWTDKSSLKATSHFQPLNGPTCNIHALTYICNKRYNIYLYFHHHLWWRLQICKRREATADQICAEVFFFIVTTYMAVSYRCKFHMLKVPNQNVRGATASEGGIAALKKIYFLWGIQNKRCWVPNTSRYISPCKSWDQLRQILDACSVKW